MKSGFIAAVPLAALLVACGGLARDPEGDAPPPFSESPSDPPVATPPEPASNEPPRELQPDTALVKVVRCTDPSGAPSVDLNLTTAWDYVAMRLITTRWSVESEGIGEACINARDVQTCGATYSTGAPQGDSDWTECDRSGCQKRLVVLTDGDDVHFYDSRAEVLGLLGRIDTAREAALWARLDGFEATCDQTIFAQPADGSYLLAVGEPPRECGEQTSTLYIRVMPDGTIIQQRRDENTNTPGCGDTIR